MSTSAFTASGPRHVSDSRVARRIASGASPASGTLVYHGLSLSTTVVIYTQRARKTLYNCHELLNLLFSSVVKSQ